MNSNLLLLLLFFITSFSSANNFTCFSLPSTHPKVCNSRGYCIAPNVCACKNGYQGNQCEIAVCHGIVGSDARVCASHGKCIKHNVCQCVSYRRGHNCEKTLVYLRTHVWGKTTTKSVEKLDGMVNVVIGEDHKLFLARNGSLYAQGKGVRGQLGNGEFRDSLDDLVLVDSPLFTDVIIHLSAGNQFSMVVTGDGKAFSFGNNQYGQLGIGQMEDKKNVPVRIPVYERIVQAHASNGFGLILTDEGRVYGFGKNSENQLGLQTLNYSVPIPVRVPIPEMKFATQISVGDAHALVLTSDGNVYSFGDNSLGQLGDGTTNQRLGIVNVFHPIYNIKIKAIASGKFHNLVLDINGNVYAFGDNSEAQLGDGTRTNKPFPVRILHGYKIASIYCGAFHSIVVTEDGYVFSFGKNDEGQLGDGTRERQAAPVRVQMLSEQMDTSDEAIDSEGNPRKKIVSLFAGNEENIVITGYEDENPDPVSCFGVPHYDRDVCSGNGRCVKQDSCECVNGFNGVECDGCFFGYIENGKCVFRLRDFLLMTLVPVGGVCVCLMFASALSGIIYPCLKMKRVKKKRANVKELMSRDDFKFVPSQVDTQLEHLSDRYLITVDRSNEEKAFNMIMDRFLKSSGAQLDQLDLLLVVVHHYLEKELVKTIKTGDKILWKPKQYIKTIKQLKARFSEFNERRILLFYELDFIYNCLMCFMGNYNVEEWFTKVLEINHCYPKTYEGLFKLNEVVCDDWRFEFGKILLLKEYKKLNNEHISKLANTMLIHTTRNYSQYKDVIIKEAQSASTKVFRSFDAGIC